MIEKLEAAGWEVVDNPGHILLRAAGSAPDVGFARINKNTNGTLQLVTTRSAFHRQIAAALEAADAAPGDYQPRAYGQ